MGVKKMEELTTIGITVATALITIYGAFSAFLG